MENIVLFRYTVAQKDLAKLQEIYDVMRAKAMADGEPRFLISTEDIVVEKTAKLIACCAFVLGIKSFSYDAI